MVIKTLSKIKPVTRLTSLYKYSRLMFHNIKRTKIQADYTLCPSTAITDPKDRDHTAVLTL